MKGKLLVSSLIFMLVALLLGACSVPPVIVPVMQSADRAASGGGRSAAAAPFEQRETLFQHSTLDALMAGVYDGELTIRALKRHGDFGLGTFDRLNGEMIVADGQVYQAVATGAVHVADDGTTTPFAAVTFFDPDTTMTLDGAFSCDQLHEYLDQQLPSANVPYAIRVSGYFPALQIRSVAPQQAPYPSLTDALAKQVVFDQQQFTGSLIGFRLPVYLAGANQAGYHFHFISDDRQVGGHVLDCTAGPVVTLAYDAIDTVVIDLPQTGAFQDATLPN